MATVVGLECFGRERFDFMIVDLPEVDTVMVLRPTESAIIWLQQVGRGLRWLDLGTRHSALGTRRSALGTERLAAAMARWAMRSSLRRGEADCGVVAVGGGGAGTVAGSASSAGRVNLFAFSWLFLSRGSWYLVAAADRLITQILAV